MTTDIDTILDRIIAREGGYVNHPADRGGPTRYGITLKTLAAWRGAEVSAADVRELTQAEARRILRERYVLGPGFHRLEDAPLRAQVIDAGVLHGPGWAARRLQEAVGVAADGVIGPETLRAVNFALKTDGPRVRASPGPRTGLAGRFAARRIRKLARIVAADLKRRIPPEQWGQVTFLVGWMDRATEFLMR